MSTLHSKLSCLQDKHKFKISFKHINQNIRIFYAEEKGYFRKGKQRNAQFLLTNKTWFALFSMHWFWNPQIKTMSGTEEVTYAMHWKDACSASAGYRQQDYLSSELSLLYLVWQFLTSSSIYLPAKWQIFSVLFVWIKSNTYIHIYI